MGYGYLLKDDLDNRAKELIVSKSKGTIVEMAQLYLEDQENSFIESVIEWYKEKKFLSETQLFHVAKFVIKMGDKYE